LLSIIAIKLTTRITKTATENPSTPP